jgi:hypothetical protein
MSNQGTVRLKVLNSAPSVEKLWNGRYRLEFLCDNNSAKLDWYYDDIGGILPDYGILQETSFGTGVGEDWQAIPASVFPNMRLVETGYVFIPSIGDKRVQLTYETLTSAWVEDKDEDEDHELNGLKKISRTFVALPDTAYTSVIGTTTITSGGITLYLAKSKIEKTDAIWELSEVWLEAGVLSKEEGQGSSSIPNSKQHVWQTLGLEPTSMPGIITNKVKNDILGFTAYRYTSISSMSGGDPSTGTLSSYQESIDVKQPGVVDLFTFTISGSIAEISGDTAYATMRPPAVGKLVAQVDVTISTSATADTPVAYNLSGIYTSMTEISSNSAPAKVKDSGTGVLWRQSTSVNQTPLPYYVRSSSKWPSDPSSINGLSQALGLQDDSGSSFYGTVSKTITLTGSVDTDVPTTGIYDSNVVPIFQSIDGTQYYRKTNYTLS